MRRQQMPKPRPLQCHLPGQREGLLERQWWRGLPVRAGDEHGVGAFVVYAGDVVGWDLHVVSGGRC